MATKICTACGYEGTPIRPPSDAAGEDESFVIGIVNKLIFVATFMPIKVNGLVRLFSRGRAKHCPNCGLPLMVSLKSDAGWLAKRRQEIKAGLRFDTPEKPVVAFGREIKLPGEEVETKAPVVAPVSLPALDQLLEAEEHTAPVAPDETKEAAPAPTKKKPVDPDQW